jgi:molybdopterin adenylyltransferase
VSLPLAWGDSPFLPTTPHRDSSVAHPRCQYIPAMNFTPADHAAPPYHGDVARVAVLTVSDSAAAGTRTDRSGDLLAERLAAAGHHVVARSVLPDEREAIAALLRQWCDAGGCDVVITTGGTGLTPRDVTPEATLEVAERLVPALPLAIALEGLRHTPYAALSRGVAVIRGRTLIVNLPGSPKAVEDGLAVLLPLLDHAAELLAGPVDHDVRAP